MAASEPFLNVSPWKRWDTPSQARRRSPPITTLRTAWRWAPWIPRPLNQTTWGFNCWSVQKRSASSNSSGKEESTIAPTNQASTTQACNTCPSGPNTWLIACSHSKPQLTVNFFVQNSIFFSLINLIKQQETTFKGVLIWSVLDNPILTLMG